MREFIVERSALVRQNLEAVYAFFSDPKNLQELTPAFLDFQVLGSSTETVQVGTTIDYRLKVRGVPIRWRSLISAWDPPYSFVDEQVAGPYRMWHHTHTFEETDEGVRVGDRVRYAVPGGPLLERLVERFLVGPDVCRIFDFRMQRLGELFDS